MVGEREMHSGACVSSQFSLKRSPFFVIPVCEDLSAGGLLAYLLQKSLPDMFGCKPGMCSVLMRSQIPLYK